MFGIDDLAIAGAIASLAGAGMSYAGSAKAANRTAAAQNEALKHHQQYQQLAAQTALDRAKDYATEKRQSEQSDITRLLAENYATPALDASAINQQGATTQGDTSTDYTRAKTASDARVQQDIATLANLMARVNGAKQLRLNESWRNADAASKLGAAQNIAQIQNTIDNYNIQQAAQSGNGLNALGNILGLAGTAMGITGALNGLGTKAATQGIIGAAGTAGNATGNAVLQKTATLSPTALDQHATLGLLGNLY